MELIKEALVNGLIGIVVAVIGVAATGLRSYILARAEQLKAHKTAEEWDMLRSIAYTVVEAVEQIAKKSGITGGQKFAYALELLDTELNKRGFDLTENQKKMLVEASVKNMNVISESVVTTVTE